MAAVNAGNPTLLMAQQLGLGAQEIDAVMAGDVTPLAARVCGSDPMMAAMLAYMKPPPPQDATEEDPEERAAMLIARLKQRLEAAREIIWQVSEIAGACSLCLGFRSDCPRCRGRGRPGSTDPLAEDLARWIAPALRRAGLTAGAAPAGQPNSNAL